MVELFWNIIPCVTCVFTLRKMSNRTIVRQVPLLLMFVLYISSTHGQVSYSIPEEMAKGSVVGNIAQDLGLDLKRLKSGKARIYTGDNTEYLELNKERGVLLIKERIDREALCGQTTPCALHFQVILDSPMEFYSVTVEILDVNDNAPSFKKNQMKFKISESALPGARFVLEKAMDSDIGTNGLQSYSINPKENFALKLQNEANGGKVVEMVLQKTLDRESKEYIVLILTATDGGDPKLSGTAEILITVLDANDNAPVFTQTIYKATITENAPKGTLLATVSATDADLGSNGKISYSLTHNADDTFEMFQINESDGELRLIGDIDYEKAQHLEIHIQASDEGGLTDSSKVVVDVVDTNDNKPVINIMSKSPVLPEDSKPGTVITMINIQDQDSGDNGKVHCLTDDNVPFTLKSSSNNFFSLVTDDNLDREQNPSYNISVTCSDEGVPSLSNSVSLSLQISDVNDNAPVFEKSSYEAFVLEHNSPGLSIFSVKAKDADWNQNSRVSYIMEESLVNGVTVSSFVSVNAESGVIHAVRSFDYEQIKDFAFHIKAQDGGSPPLTSSVRVKIIIQDQNDNTPQILYPVQSSGSLVAEIVPRSADVGYLVTKVVAIDVDSGQNAWLSYKLQKATDRALFEVGPQNGEIRTIRQITDKDAVKQKLAVVVEDNGQPSRSATVNVNVALADSFPEVLSEFSDFTHDKEYNDNLTFYLVLALAVVSFLFIVSIIAILSVKCYRWRRERMLYKSNGNLPVIPYYPPLYADVGGTGTLQHVYNYEVCRTTDSRKSDLKYGRACSQSIISLDNSGTLPHAQRENLMSDDFDDTQKPPNQDWRFNQNQRPGPSGRTKSHSPYLRWTPPRKIRATANPDVPVGTGPWPQPPTEAEQLQALMAAANEVSEATNTLTPGTMGLSTRYSPQFTLQHVPDYRQNVYIPGSTATLGSNPQQQMLQQQLQQQHLQQQHLQQQQQLQLQQQMLPQREALPPPQAVAAADDADQPDASKANQTPASKKKSTKKDKK
ncbi:protocadherin beta-16-like isoform X3 [Clupea harengus]|uniref:Protocadherin beta-16-like isoform X3 n=1 Tax=Clupea harengus TaxID=7950 RepID=A0A6P8GYK7_CLUHA|nr:protocadherin beta-16-like isoform X3 [Clupea harengus]